MNIRNDTKPTKKAFRIANDLFTAWEMPLDETSIALWSKLIYKLGISYDNYHEMWIRSNSKEQTPDTKIKPISKDRQRILINIAFSASALLDALHEAKDIHPDFIRDHLHFQDGDADGGLLRDLETEKNIETTPFIQTNLLLMTKAWTQFIVEMEAGSSPNILSFKYGHPSLRLLVECLVTLEIMKVNDPLKKLKEFSRAVYETNQSGPDFDLFQLIPNWEDCAPQVKLWWKVEGRAFWSPILARPSIDPGGGADVPHEEWLANFKDVLEKMHTQWLHETQLGGPYPDERLHRARKSGCK